MKVISPYKNSQLTWVVSKIRKARAEGNEAEAIRLQKEFILSSTHIEVVRFTFNHIQPIVTTCLKCEKGLYDISITGLCPNCNYLN